MLIKMYKSGVCDYVCVGMCDHLRINLIFWIRLAVGVYIIKEFLAHYIFEQV